jgi:hypothetical protein
MTSSGSKASANSTNMVQKLLRYKGENHTHRLWYIEERKGEKTRAIYKVEAKLEWSFATFATGYVTEIQIIPPPLGAVKFGLSYTYIP